MTTTISRRDINLTEEVEDAATWTAEVFGNLSTGEFLSMSRTASTRQEAYTALEQALAEQGWSIA